MHKCMLAMTFFGTYEFWLCLTLFYDLIQVVFWLVAYYYFIIKVSSERDINKKFLADQRFVDYFFQILKGPDGSFELKDERIKPID